MPEMPTFSIEKVKHHLQTLLAQAEIGSDSVDVRVCKAMEGSSFYRIAGIITVEDKSIDFSGWIAADYEIKELIVGDMVLLPDEGLEALRILKEEVSMLIASMGGGRGPEITSVHFVPRRQCYAAQVVIRGVRLTYTIDLENQSITAADIRFDDDFSE